MSMGNMDKKMNYRRRSIFQNRGFIQTKDVLEKYRRIREKMYKEIKVSIFIINRDIKVKV